MAERYAKNWLPERESSNERTHSAHHNLQINYIFLEKCSRKRLLHIIAYHLFIGGCLVRDVPIATVKFARILTKWFSRIYAVTRFQFKLVRADNWILILFYFFVRFICFVRSEARWFGDTDWRCAWIAFLAVRWLVGARCESARARVCVCGAVEHMRHLGNTFFICGHKSVTHVWLDIHSKYRQIQQADSIRQMVPRHVVLRPFAWWTNCWRKQKFIICSGSDSIYRYCFLCIDFDFFFSAQ